MLTQKSKKGKHTVCLSVNIFIHSSVASCESKKANCWKLVRHFAAEAARAHHLNRVENIQDKNAKWNYEELLIPQVNSQFNTRDYRQTMTFV